jgi:hypothetical protein
LVSVYPASEKFDSDLKLDAGMHPYPPMPNNIAPMPTQNPWAWAPNVGLCTIPSLMYEFAGVFFQKKVQHFLAKRVKGF